MQEEMKVKGPSQWLIGCVTLSRSLALSDLRSLCLKSWGSQIPWSLLRFLLGLHAPLRNSCLSVGQLLPWSQ